MTPPPPTASASPSPVELVVFDLDGTLVDSVGGILRCIRQTVEALELPPEVVDAWRDLIGLPLLVQLERVLPPARGAEAARGVELYRRFYHRLRDDDLGRPFAGVLELVDELRGRVPLAIVTSKSRAGTDEALGRLGWRGRFDPVLTPEAVSRPKPHEESLLACLAAHRVPAARALYVGDSRFDMEMAARAGLDGWGAAWGVHGAGELAAAGATRCFDSPPALGRAILAALSDRTTAR